MKVYWNKNTLKIVESCYKSNMPLLLMWETWVGKTTIVREVAKAKKKTITRINLNGQTGREEILGKYVLDKWATVRQDWPMLNALRNGDWILLDEINAALPEVLFTLQALIETKDGKLGDINLVEKDWEVITPHKDCRIFATANPADRYIWAKDFNVATLSRFVVMDVDKLSTIDEIELLKDMFPKLDEGYIIKCVDISAKINKEYNEENIWYYCSTRDLIHTLELVSTKISFSLALQTAILNKVQDRTEKKDVQKIISKIEKIKLDLQWADLKDIVQTIKNMDDFKKQKATLVKELKEVKDANSDLEAKLAKFDTIEWKFSEAANLFSNL